ncbi:hypothetical protein ABZ016_16530 [Streptomyces sp. NPDC006372]|uniref:hypothetical protein n=1 Tax=Streptomyces sp. NPDC006372 TaxID=3155599 RepID=UPI0033A6115B
MRRDIISEDVGSNPTAPPSAQIVEHAVERFLLPAERAVQAAFAEPGRLGAVFQSEEQSPQMASLLGSTGNRSQPCNMCTKDSLGENCGAT